MNTKRQFELLEDEEVLLENGPAVLTNQRLLANWRESKGQEIWDEARLKEVANVRTVNGGVESRIQRGLAAGAIGIVLILSEAVVRNVSTTLGAVVFMVGALMFAYGLHVLIRSFLRQRPHTTLLFSVPGAKDIPVSFLGRDNPDAEELNRAFARARRRAEL